MTAPVALTPDVVESDDEVTGDRAPLIVLDALTGFLDRHDLGAGPLSADPIGDGHSNPTFMLKRGSQHWVLRRPPRPPLPPSAHDVLREHRLLAALKPTRVRSPTPVVACDDVSVIGAPFYLMEPVDGVVLSGTIPEALDDPPTRRGLAFELVDALAELHAVDRQSPGLQGLGRPEGYLARQLQRFSELWQRNRTRELPVIERVADRLTATMPTSAAACVVHGDYRLGNVMYAAKPPARLVAVFDWELATVGDPLADLGYLLASYAEPGEDPGALGAVASLTQRPGFPSRAELVDRYEQHTQRRAEAIGWYQALAHFKLAVILEGSYKRLLAGATDDAWLAGMAAVVPELADRAWQAISR